MSQARFTAYGIALMVMMVANLPASACEGEARVKLDTPVKLTGVLKEGKGEHEAQGPFRYVYLALDAPVCVELTADASEDEPAPEGLDTPVGRIQIAGEASNSELPIGSLVAVEGTLYAAHTMWHVEDVLIDADDVKPVTSSD